MAQEIELLQEEIIDLTESLSKLNRTVLDSSGALSQQINQVTKASQKGAQTIQAFTKATEDSTKSKKEETKETEKLSTAQKEAKEELRKFRDTQRDATNYVSKLAKEQYEAAQQSKTLSSYFERLAGENKEYHTTLIKARATLAALAPLGKGFADVGKALYEGKQGAEVNNAALDGLGKSAETLLAGFGPLGIIVGKLVKWFFGYVQEANKLSDRLYKSYQDLSKVGITAQDGMIGVAESAQRLGFGLDETGIAEFGKLMKAASVDLALMSGSAVKGRQDFTEFASGVVRGEAGRELMNLGMSVEQVNEGLASYMGLQARVGMAQNKTQAQLQAGATAYLKEMDMLTKLTGLQRQELEEGINKARAVEAFRAKVEDLRAQGREKEAQQMENYYAVLQKQAPKLAQGYAESAAGLIVSPEGRQFFQAIESGTGVVEGLSSGTMDATKALAATYKQAKLSEEQFRGLAMAMASGDVIGSYTELADIAKRSGIDTEESARLIREVQEAQSKGPGGVAAQTDMRRAQMDTRDSLQNFVLKGVQPATSAMSSFASVVSTVTSMLGGPTPKMGAAGGAGAGAAAGGGGGAGAGAGAAAGGGGGAGAAAGGGVFGAVGRFVGKVMSGGIGGPINPEDVIKFAGNTGSREHFDKLQPNVRDAFLAMARDYNNLTGDKLQINSAFRSLGEQAAVDSGANPKAAPGMSLHNQGRALDIQSAQKNYLAGAGLLDQYGFKTLPNDPPHIFMQTGGIAAGPRSGYQATLHGTEAVVPLPDGKTIPVEMPNLDRSMEQQVSMMGAQLVALEELVRYMRENASISAKILQAAHN